MGCTSSTQRDHRREAEEYAKRKKNGFKDPGLEKFRKETVKQKKKLKHVDDPDQRRKEKQANIKKNNHKYATTTTTTATTGGKKGKKSGNGGGGGGGLTDETIQAQRKKLKHVHR